MGKIYWPYAVFFFGLLLQTIASAALPLDAAGLADSGEWRLERVLHSLPGSLRSVFTLVYQSRSDQGRAWKTLELFFMDRMPDLSSPLTVAKSSGATRRWKRSHLTTRSAFNSAKSSSLPTEQNLRNSPR